MEYAIFIPHAGKEKNSFRPHESPQASLSSTVLCAVFPWQYVSVVAQNLDTGCLFYEAVNRFTCHKKISSGSDLQLRERTLALLSEKKGLVSVRSEVVICFVLL